MTHLLYPSLPLPSWSAGGSRGFQQVTKPSLPTSGAETHLSNSSTRAKQRSHQFCRRSGKCFGNKANKPVRVTGASWLRQQCLDRTMYSQAHYTLKRKALAKIWLHHLNDVSSIITQKNMFKIVCISFLGRWKPKERLRIFYATLKWTGMRRKLLKFTL